MVLSVEWVLVWKNVAVFPGGNGRIGEILHERIWPDWGP